MEEKREERLLRTLLQICSEKRIQSGEGEGGWRGRLIRDRRRIIEGQRR
jgi:hypothetical protein